jgi:tRNA nucleotidyltransferase (CCA-adding enzyme)
MKRGEPMKKFLVGGAVRDMLMGLEPKDRDYVVVGSSPEEMLAAGFSQVGADFPVYLHPETGDEYALARREKKTGTGYLGFTSEFGTDVTLVEDLGRRDLTINSISMERMEDTEFFVPGDEGSYAVFDPYGGKDDLTAKVLRHTSNAFEEDPVRVLRLARFRARFGPDWTVAPETVTLVASMAKRGTLNELTAERVWKELSRALMEPHPRLFFDTLLECDALHVLFPEVYRLKTALESRRWHPEGDAYEHTMLVLTQASIQNFDFDSTYAALVHDFGKGITPRDQLPKHHGHDVKGVAVVESFSNRLTVPAKTRDRAMKATRYHMRMHDLDKLNAKTVVTMFDDMGALNDPDSVRVLFNVGICDERGRLGSEMNSLDHLYVLNRFFAAYKSVKFADVFPNGETVGEKIKMGMYRARVQAVKAA